MSSSLCGAMSCRRYFVSCGVRATTAARQQRGYGSGSDYGGGNQNYGGGSSPARMGGGPGRGPRQHGNYSQRMGGRMDGHHDSFQALRAVDWNVEGALPPFQKDLYKECEAVSAMSDAEVSQVQQTIQATMRGKEVPCPVTRFEHMQPTFGDTIMEEIRGQNFEKPTPIQQCAWPILSSGRDHVGVAQTGSGKTLAYLLPAMNHIQNQDRIQQGEGPITCVMAPTRELVQQIVEEAHKFGKLTGIRTAAAYGGASRTAQANELRAAPAIIVATPGRLLDFLETGVTNLHRVTYLVLDEADRMLDMGFEKDIRKICGQCRPDRQTVMFSATWPRSVQGLARDFCREDPTMVVIGSTELQANADITQDVRVVRYAEKKSQFEDLLDEIQRGDASSGSSEGKKSAALIFVSRKTTADQMERALRQKGMGAAAIHGDKAQRDRDACLADFKSGRLQFLIATDVAQRGLDVKNCDIVINYDMPNNIEDYTHRIGRTGRAGKKGRAITFFENDGYSATGAQLAGEIVKSMRTVGQQPTLELRRVANC